MNDRPKFYDLFDKQPTNRPPPIYAAVNGNASAYVTAALNRETELVATARVGTRNDVLNTAAYNLAGLIATGHLIETEVRDRLTAAARSNGLDDAEIAATVSSGLKAGKANPRNVPDPVDITGGIVLDGFSSEPEATEIDAFWQARPFLTHIHTFARARRVSPWAVLGVVLARIATVTPPLVVLPPIVGGHASLNVYVGLVGTSGSGKGAAEATANEAFNVGPVTTQTTGSGEGIAHGYMKRTRDGIEQHNHSVLFSVPEIDTLTALGNRQGATLLPELRRAWSGEALGFAYADPTKRLPVPAHESRLCLVAGIQPARAGALLDDIDAGTPQRFLWLPATDPGAPRIAPDCPPPMVWRRPVWGRLSDIATPSGRLVIPVCKTAITAIVNARVDRLTEEQEALDGHALLAQLKTAATLAIAESRLEVTEDDWELSSVIARKSAATRSAVARTLSAAVTARNKGRALAEADRTLIVSEKVEDAAIRRVARHVAKQLAQGGTATTGALRRALPSWDRHLLPDALERLLMAGQIEPVETDGITTYRLAGQRKDMGTMGTPVHIEPKKR